MGVGFVNMLMAPPDHCKVTELADVVMINRYYGWYVQTGDLDAAEPALEAELHAWAAKHGKPIIVTEYGADAMPGLHSLDAAGRSVRATPLYRPRSEARIVPGVASPP